ncbi:MAG: NAD-dependent epimerase/dehydratase family protein [Woeseiaceae bacterium]|nr:NAD-dependent epimerase/dehydratase family protein [Woeseiaceae bacterium]
MTDTTWVVGVGYTGARLLEQLPGSVGVSRSGDGGKVIRLDLDAGGVPAADAPGAIVYTVPPPRDSDSDRRLESLLSMLQPKPKRFVYLSTTGVYGNRDGGRVDETTPVRPESERAQRRVAAETALQTWSEDGDVEIVILRVPGIYGPGRLGLDRIRERAPVIDDAEANPGNRIHVDDLVRACIAALDAAVPAGIYNLGDGDTRSSSWFTFEVARQAGLEPPPVVSLAEAEQTFSPMRLSFLCESRIVDVERMRTVLKPALAYADASDGIAASLAEASTN